MEIEYRKFLALRLAHPDVEDGVGWRPAVFGIGELEADICEVEQIIDSSKRMDRWVCRGGCVHVFSDGIGWSGARVEPGPVGGGEPALVRSRSLASMRPLSRSAVAQASGLASDWITHWEYSGRIALVACCSMYLRTLS